jgi:hypothetical protein
MGTAGRSAPLRRAGSLLGLLGLELGAVLALHWLGRFPGLRVRWDEPVPWVLSSPVQEVLGALLRTVGLVMAYWLLASTVLYLLASLTRLPAAVRAVSWATLPLARRVADHAVAVTLATSMVGGSTLGVAGPALAADRGGGTGPPARKPVAAAQQDPPPSSADEPPATPYTPEPADQAPTSGSGTTTPPTTEPEATEPPATPYVPEPADQAPRGVPPPGETTTTKAAATTAPTATAGPTTTTAPTTTVPPTTTTAAPTTTTAAPTTSTAAPTTTTAAPTTTTAAPSTSTAAPTTGAPATTTPATTQGTAAPTTTAPGATRQATPGPTTTHAYEFNPASPSTDSPPPPPPPPPTSGPGGPGGEGGGDTGGSGGGDTRSEDEEQPYRVASGDNLWTIARAHLARARGGGSGEPTNREVADYWIRVVEANRDGLRSGDPDLIYPGEEITLPPVD